MAQPSVIQEGIDRIEDARRSFEKRYKKIQKQADKRRREFEKTAEQRVRQIRDDITNNPIVKRVVVRDAPPADLNPAEPRINPLLMAN